MNINITKLKYLYSNILNCNNRLSSSCLSFNSIDFKCINKLNTTNRFYHSSNSYSQSSNKTHFNHDDSKENKDDNQEQINDKNYNNKQKEDKYNENEKENIAKSSKETLIVTLKAVGIIYLVREYVISYSLCSGSSMQPTLNSSGDIVFIDKTNMKPYKRDDIIMAVSPTNPSDNICKRIKYLEGDSIVMDTGYGSRRIDIPKGYCWIEGDNPHSSFDSRSYGCIPMSLIKGRVIFRLYPFSWLDSPPPKSISTHKIN
ncbi:hypothetical protein PPL_09302 [Heterostelium album PN500]|uniref:Peptidase S26 domain-containing protein n=1 Tax=Heterostelium pallidum (strain ATCC 26659 / Pp 5 / PN500) TaxID=670386 RepID=D3BL70_HETP5|nr:hypothetical protein PPL_09302 [Heterostelium album PN500]EFA77804.1 hypothetical protein PPL_09302 [Heterostelium album PN500]|eukprot:XP_020429932.1 hypothetical protein PPL_09302 [Heterostelium album PN500]